MKVAAYTGGSIASRYQYINGWKQLREMTTKDKNALKRISRCYIRNVVIVIALSIKESEVFEEADVIAKSLCSLLDVVPIVDIHG